MSEPSTRVAPSKLGLVILSIVAVLGGLHAFSFLGAGPFDDDFIVHRYARMWVQGEGLAFNPGEHVEGFTVPLWLFLSAGVQLLGLDPVAASQWVSIVAAGVASLFIGLAWRLHASPSAWPIPSFILACAPTFAWHGAAGLGTTALAACLAAWFYCWERNARCGHGSRAAAVSLAAACFLRQECALFVLPYALWEWRQGRRFSALPALLSLASWTLFRWFYFGRWLPMTYAVKKLSIADDLSYGTRYLLDSTWECGLPLFLLVAVWGWRRGHMASRPGRPSPRNALLAALSLHTLYVVWVGGDFMPWSRFLMPTLPLVLYLACVALQRALQRLPMFALVLTLAAAALPQWLQFGWTIHGRPQRFGEHAFFEQRWQRLGECFHERFPRNARIALAPIGAFGYSSELYITDILGLTQAGLDSVAPDMSILMKGHHRSDPDWVLLQKPDAMILGNGVLQPPSGELVINPWERTLVQHPEFQRLYGAARMTIPKSGPLVFFLRRGSRLPEATIWL